MKNMDIKKMLEWLSFLLRCPLCGQKYNVENTKILESDQSEALDETRFLIHSDCSKCKSSVMFNVDLRGAEVLSVGMVTDLTRGDSTKFRDLDPISPDEVLDIHKSIRKFNGDFIRAFTPTQK
jgi:hypothetical protein